MECQVPFFTDFAIKKGGHRGEGQGHQELIFYNFQTNQTNQFFGRILNFQEINSYVDFFILCM